MPNASFLNPKPIRIAPRPESHLVPRTQFIHSVSGNNCGASWCIVEGCNSIAKHLLPLDNDLKLKWIWALHLHQNTTKPLRKYSRVCSRHFKPEDFIWANRNGEHIPIGLKDLAIPSIIKPRNVKSALALKKSDQLRTYSKPVLPTAFVQELPSLETQECKNSSNNADPLGEPMEIKTEPCLALDQLNAAKKTHIEDVTIKVEPEPDLDLDQLSAAIHTEDVKVIKVESDEKDVLPTDDDKTKQEIDLSSDSFIEIEIDGQCTQDSQDKKKCECQKLQTNSQRVQQFDKCVQTDAIYDSEYDGLSIHKMRKSEQEIQFYTGLGNYNQFYLIFDSLGQSVYNLKYFYSQPPKHLDPMDQLLVVLIVLYRHKTYEELSILFKTNIKQIFNLFITWIRFMALQWKQINLWVDNDTLHSHVPSADLKPPTHILDVIECQVRKPHHETAQKMINLLTNKDQQCVLKFLIVISPGGMISHVSPGYGGSVSDRQIIERSPILGRFTAGDEILVGKGINTETFMGTNNIKDIFEPLGVKVNTPGLSKKNGHPLVNTVLTSFHKRVVKRCCDVERQLMKYRILTSPTTHSDTMLCSDIVFVCAMLVNFKQCFKT
ncbi:hypothetical protein O0L34_g14890 [Tuta absoluta]|nr:hypothetical protein O0L34_g14890 [Tuta absoluta]